MLPLDDLETILGSSLLFRCLFRLRRMKVRAIKETKVTADKVTSTIIDWGFIPDAR